MHIKSLGWTEAGVSQQNSIKPKHEPRYDPTDLASDQEAARRECDCLIHSRARNHDNGGASYYEMADTFEPQERIKEV